MPSISTMTIRQRLGINGRGGSLRVKLRHERERRGGAIFVQGHGPEYYVLSTFCQSLPFPGQNYHYDD